MWPSVSAAKPTRICLFFIAPSSAAMSTVGSSSIADGAFAFLIFPPATVFALKSATAAALTTTSASSKRAMTASRISCAVRTRTTSTRSGAGSDTGAEISVTAPPRFAASRASAKPILPLERLLMYRTGSIGSCVPPAVTITRAPARSWPRASVSATARQDVRRLRPHRQARPLRDRR